MNLTGPPYIKGLNLLRGRALSRRPGPLKSSQVQQDQTRRILISGRSSPPDTFKLNSKAIFLAGAAAIFVLSLLQTPVHAQAATSPNEVISSTSAKFIAAGLGLCLAGVR